MNKKNNSITLFLPSMFEDIPITIVRGIHSRQVLIDIQSKNVEVNRKDITACICIYQWQLYPDHARQDSLC